MLYEWLEQNLLLYGMVIAGFLGISCVAVVDQFYSKIIRDIHRINDPRVKWTKSFLAEYQKRLDKKQEMNNPEVFIRSQLSRGKILGMSLTRWKQGIGYGAIICFLLMMAAIYGTYQYQEIEMARYQYILVGSGIFALLLLMKQFMGFISKEDMILDGLMDYMENRTIIPEKGPAEEKVMEQLREELVTRIAEGVTQTAAGNNRYSQMLTPEEDKIMRDVIRAYIV